MKEKEQEVSKCCNAPIEWAYRDKDVVSNRKFKVCSKCKQGLLDKNIYED